MSNKYVIHKSENSTVSIPKDYHDSWYLWVEDSSVPVGFRILVDDTNHGNSMQRIITEHQGNNVWTRMCFLYTKDDPIPEFHRNGKQWISQMVNKNIGKFTEEDDEECVPGKVKWEKPKEESESPNLWAKLTEDCIAPPSLIPEIDEFYSKLENMSEEEKNNLPMFDVDHRYRTRSYRIDEPFALTPLPACMHAEMHTHYEKIRENMILEYIRNKK